MSWPVEPGLKGQVPGSRTTRPAMSAASRAAVQLRGMVSPQVRCWQVLSQILYQRRLQSDNGDSALLQEQSTNDSNDSRFSNVLKMCL